MCGSWLRSLEALLARPQWPWGRHMPVHSTVSPSVREVARNCLLMAMAAVVWGCLWGRLAPGLWGSSSAWGHGLTVAVLPSALGCRDPEGAEPGPAVTSASPAWPPCPPAAATPGALQGPAAKLSPPTGSPAQPTMCLICLLAPLPPNKRFIMHIFKL